MADSTDNDCYVGYSLETRPLQKVVEWLVSIPNVVGHNNINTDVVLKAVNSRNRKSVSIFSDTESLCSSVAVFKSSNVERKKRQNLSAVDEENVTKLLNSESELALKKWTLFKKLSGILELKGELLNVDSKEIITKNFYAGKILAREQAHSVRTDKGVFTLVGKLFDPNNEIPADVKKHFNKSFPVNWKKLAVEDWSNGNSKKKKNLSADSISNSKLESTNNTTVSFNTSNEVSSLLVDNKKRNRKKINEIADNISKNDSSFLNGKPATNKNKGQTKNRTKKNDFYLKNWSLAKDSHNVYLNGFLYSVISDELSQELFSAGPVISVNRNGKVVTDSGLYILMGCIHDPDGMIPDDVKKEFQYSFPKSWKKIIDENWNVEKPSAVKSVTRKGKKRENDTVISPPSKFLKVNNQDEDCDNSKQLRDKKTKNQLKTKIPVRVGKNANVIAKKEPAESPAPLRGENKGKPKRNLKKQTKIMEDNCNVSEQMNDTSIGSPDKTCQQKKKPQQSEKSTATLKKKEKNKPNIKVNRKRKSVTVPKKGSNCQVKEKKTNNGKQKKKKDENNLFAELGISGFDIQSNKTNDLFRTFDNECFDDGVPLHSFKEISLGGCVKSAQKKIKGSETNKKDTPISKYVADIFSHSVASNCTGHSQSLHSAHSSPDTKKADVVKRIEKLNKGKKVSNKLLKRNVDAKRKRYGNNEVNEVFNQITKKTNAFATTPKNIKKIFRSRALQDDLEADDEDESLVDSSANRSDSENDFL